MLLLALLGPLPGCSGPSGASAADAAGSPKVQAPPGGLLLKGAGATFPLLLYKEWFRAYQKEHAKVAIAYDAVGSGEGIRRFIGKGVDEEAAVDFGASDAALNDAQLAEVGKGALLIPVTAGSVVLAYNLPDVEKPLRLSRRACEGIFLGEIKTWNDPVIARANPGVTLPGLTIALVVRQDGSGTTFAFTKHLDAISERWRGRYGAATLVDWPGNAMRAKGNEGVAARIKQSVGSIGYINHGSARQVGLPMALLENRAGAFVAPTSASGAAGLAAAELPLNLRVFVPDPEGPDSYPIVTFTWILLYRSYADPAKAAALRELFHFCLSAGQEHAADLGYIPLPSTVTAKAAAALDTVAGGAEGH